MEQLIVSYLVQDVSNGVNLGRESYTENKLNSSGFGGVFFTSYKLHGGGKKVENNLFWKTFLHCWRNPGKSVSVFLCSLSIHV